MGAVPTHITAAWVTRLLQLLYMWMPDWRRCSEEQREEGEPLCSTVEVMKSYKKEDDMQERMNSNWTVLLFFRVFFENFQQTPLADDLHLKVFAAKFSEYAENLVCF